MPDKAEFWNQDVFPWHPLTCDLNCWPGKVPWDLIFWKVTLWRRYNRGGNVRRANICPGIFRPERLFLTDLKRPHPNCLHTFARNKDFVWIPGVPEFGVCFLHCFPLHDGKSYCIETLHGWWGHIWLLYITMWVWFDNPLVLDRILISASSKSCFFGLILVVPVYTGCPRNRCMLFQTWISWLSLMQSALIFYTL